MSRFVLKRKAGTDAVSIEKIRHLDGVFVVDSIGDCALLVESDAATLKGYENVLAGWIWAPEVQYNLA